MQQFKRSFWQLLFFLTLTLSLTTFTFVKRPKFQSSLAVTTARVWGYDAPIASNNLIAFKNDVVVKAVFSILNKFFSAKEGWESFLIHHFLLNKANLNKSSFVKTFSYVNRVGTLLTNQRFTISNNARTQGLWTREGARALMTSNFKLSSLTPAQKNQNWLYWLKELVMHTAVFESDYSKEPKVIGKFKIEKTRKNIRKLFMGWVEEEMKVQLKGTQGIQGTQGTQGNKGEQGSQGVGGNDGINGNDGVKGNKGDQGLGTQGKEGLRGTQGAQGLRGAAGQNGQIEKKTIIGLSIALGVFFCLFLAHVMAIHQKRIFSTFKSRKKSTKI